MYPDFKELLSVLNGEQAEYLVVGGYAVGIHAQPRATKDLDILIGSDPANAVAVWRALARFGAPMQDMSPGDLIQPGMFFQMGREPVRVDILSEIAGIDFNEAWSRRLIQTVDADTGLQAPFISVDDLIAAKLAAGRPQDLADVHAMQKARSSTQGRKTPDTIEPPSGSQKPPRR